MTSPGPLAADPGVRGLVSGGHRWTRVEHHATVSSTQDVALRSLTAGSEPGLVVVADAQTDGRGRGGRRWVDTLARPDGTPTNLAVSVTVRADIPTRGLVPLIAGLAVASACRAAGADPALKWPNDVLIGDRKVAGILVEQHRVGRLGDVLIIGCGIDVDWRGVGRSPQQEDWTSIAEAAGGPVDRARVLVDLLGSLEELLASAAGDRSGVLDTYRQQCATLGRKVRVLLPGGTEMAGIADTVDGDGRLVVETGSGPRVVTAGDVVHVR